MNRAAAQYDEPLDQELDIEGRRTGGKVTPPRRRSEHQRRVRPTGYNGIHRRRNKRWTW
jgi:hypothetical protein